jgi:hypothetical protein
MAQLTLQLPDELSALVVEQARLREEDPQAFVIGHLLSTLSASPAESRPDGLEWLLQERDTGPFVTVEDVHVLKQRILASAAERSCEVVNHD